MCVCVSESGPPRRGLGADLRPSVQLEVLAHAHTARLRTRSTLTHSLTQCLAPCHPIRSFTRLLAHSLPPSFMHSLTHSLTPPSTHIILSRFLHRGFLWRFGLTGSQGGDATPRGFGSGGAQHGGAGHGGCRCGRFVLSIVLLLLLAERVLLLEMAVCVCVCMCVCMCVYMCVCKHACVVCVCKYVCVQACVCMCVQTYVCVCVYKHVCVL